jgi:serine/threonine protein kinase
MIQPRAHPTNPTRYVPVLAIGQGGMGRIDLALALGVPGAEQLVVLKRLREPDQQTADERAALVWEAQLSARLTHPNIVQTLALESLEGELVVVLEYLEGATLAMLARSCAALGEPFPRPILLRAVRDVLTALTHAHDLVDYDGTHLGIVHRDVSPSNVMLTSEGVTKLLDFGIAKASRSPADTAPGLIKGKLGYMAPEQILGTTMDRRADLYAVGVILWEGLTQRKFSASGSLQECLETRLREEPVSVSEHALTVPLDLAHIVGRCLARHADHRWVSASALRAVLEQYVGLHDEDATTHDVARFVLRHCGHALELRRQAVRGQLSRLGPGPFHSLRQLAPISTPPASEDAPTAAAIPRRRSGRALPFVAAFVGAVGSCAFGALPSARARATPTGPPTVVHGASFLTAGRAPDVPRAKASALVRRDVVPSPRQRPREERSTPEVVAAASGIVTIDTYPWSRVTIDETFRGVTPLVLAPVEVGDHVVVVENPEHGRLVKTIHVTEGEPLTARWLFE